MVREIPVAGGLVALVDDEDEGLVRAYVPIPRMPYRVHLSGVRRKPYSCTGLFWVRLTG
jgi:hypothetical protein